MKKLLKCNVLRVFGPPMLAPYQKCLTFVSSTKQRQQQLHHQHTNGSTNVKSLQVQTTWTYFYLSTFFVLKRAESRQKLVPFKKGTSFWSFLMVCTMY